MSAESVPEVVRKRALAAGAPAWLDELPTLVAHFESEWSITVGSPYAGGTESFVVEATLDDGTEAVLKLLIPRAGDAMDAVRNEITALRVANGEGCARLLRDDVDRSALLLERLGTPLYELALPLAQRHEILCSAAERVWRSAPDCGLPTGAEKGHWLVDFITTTWEELDRPCSERALDYALTCAARRIVAHDDERAVLVHGDVHQWNALKANDGFKLVDPDGLLAEAEYDMGILMREDPVELLAGTTGRSGWRSAPASTPRPSGNGASSNGCRRDCWPPKSTCSRKRGRCSPSPTGRANTESQRPGSEAASSVSVGRSGRRGCR